MLLLLLLLLLLLEMFFNVWETLFYLMPTYLKSALKSNKLRPSHTQTRLSEEKEEVMMIFLQSFVYLKYC